LNRFVVLLRGVNVGKGNRVPMADFRRLLEGLGYTCVRTLLNSGNAVFASASRLAAEHAGAIAVALEQALGVRTPVIVINGRAFVEILELAPIKPPADEQSRFLIAYAATPDSLTGLAPLAAMAQPPERFVVTERAAYLHAPKGLLDSAVGEALLGRAGRGVTTRNWATANKIAALL
jgi:uncharacterized protein (DUF1697 family)